MRKILFLVLIIPSIVFGQTSGCTDVQALNYDPQAEMNDGSCVYAETVVSPDLLIINLDDEVDETSGLLWFRDMLVTHNDSGGSSKLYLFDESTGEIQQSIIVVNAENKDWEDIAMDEDYIYIGDFGNNNGNRTDLKIYRIEKDDIPNNGNAAVLADEIEFSYEDQVSFSNPDYDCESFFVRGDYLYLFSKSWNTQNTRLYKLSKSPGVQVAELIDDFNVDGLITAADRFNDRVVLLGYKDYVPFMWILFDYSSDDFFGGNKRRIDFNPITARQTEGIVFKNQDYVYISSEKTSFFANQLFGLSVAQWISMPNNVFEVGQKDTFSAFYDQSSQEIRIETSDPIVIDKLEVYNRMGKRVISSKKLMNNSKGTGIFAGDLKKGLYFVRIRHNGKKSIRKVMVM
jgi:hypothetical protein